MIIIYYGETLSEVRQLYKMQPIGSLYQVGIYRLYQYLLTKKNRMLI